MRGLTRVVALTAVMWGAGYLGWRMTATRDGADAATWMTLLVAEILGFAVFGVRVWHAWPSSRPALPRSARPDISVVIDATGAAVADVRATLIGVREMDGRPDAHVVDRLGDRWLRTVAQRVGSVVLDRDVDLDGAIAGAPCDWVLYLRPGDVPVFDLIDRVSGRCGDGAAVVQLAVDDVDPTPLDDGPGPWSATDAFERQVMRPALAARVSVPWYGDSPALVRTGAIANVGLARRAADCMADEADRWWRTGVRLLQAGERITAVPDVLVRGRSPRSLDERLRLRRDVAARRRRSLRAVERPIRVGPSTQLAHLAAGMGAVMGAWVRLLQAAALVLVLGFGQVPLVATFVGLLVIMAPTYILRWSAHLLLGQGRLGPLSLLRGELRTLGADLGVLGLSSSKWWLRRQIVLNGMLVALIVAAGTRVFAIWRSWESHLPGATAAALALAAVLIGVATGVAADCHTAVQRRAHRRVRLGLVTCRVEEHEGFLVDLSLGGVSVLLPTAGEAALTPASVTTLSFRVPATNGQWRAVSTVVRVVRSSVDDEGGVRLGLEFDDPTAGPLDTVEQFLAR